MLQSAKIGAGERSVDKEKTVYSYITEMTACQQADEVYVHIYDFPAPDETNKYEGVYPIYRAWQKANRNIAIAYNQSTLMTFTKIEHFEGFQPRSYEYRTIDCNSSFERALLERLIKNSFLVAAQPLRYFKRMGHYLYIRESKPLQTNTVLIFKVLVLHVNIIDNRIHIGFHLTHKFEYKYTVQQLLERHIALKRGMKVIHGQYTYDFEQLADYSVMDECPLLKCSIYDYYMSKGLTHIANTLHERIKVVHVRAKDQHLSYAANLLKPMCSFETMNQKEIQEVSQHIKMCPTKRMNQTLTYMSALRDVYPYLTFRDKPFLIEHNGYERHSLHTPTVTFDGAHRYVATGLKSDKLYKGGDMHLSVFLDEDFVHRLNISRTRINQFIVMLKTLATSHGVHVHISNASKRVKGAFTDDFFEQFSFNIKELQAIFQHTTVLAFITERHLAAMPHNIYRLFKQQFGGEWNVTSQIVTEKCIKAFTDFLAKEKQLDFSTIDNETCERLAMKLKHNTFCYTMFNILLGLYVKSGLQPWVLTNPTHSDCFIGLDVSHENGNSAAGMINVIGNKGHMIKQASIHGRLAGEKIDEELLKKLLADVLQAYHTHFKRYPKHITLHRDGFWRESTTVIDEVLKKHNIHYDIVEIIKKPNRRMAHYDISSKKFYTTQGTCYIRGKEALLCATNPKESIGMAQPIKIHQLTDCLQFEQIVKDVYHLSFMHIHAMNKMRLPATIHYADLSATAYQRGEILPQHKNNTSLPFV